MNIVFLSHTDHRDDIVVGSHHLSRELALQGHRVLHASFPVSLLHIGAISSAVVRRRFAKALRGPFQLENGVWEWVPRTVSTWRFCRATPWLRLPFRSSVRKALRKAGMFGVDLLLVDDVRLARVDLGEKPSRAIYRSTDLYSEMLADSAILEEERFLLDSVDGVVATSQAVGKHLVDLSGREDVCVIENGVDDSFFSSSKVPKDATNRNGFVYVGAVDFRFDFNFVKELSKLCPKERVDIYGPISVDLPKSGLGENVSFLGSVDYTRLPSLLNNYQVGLIPMNSHGSNQGRCPMKYYEYLASGLSVLASRTEVLEGRMGSFLWDGVSPLGDLANLALRWESSPGSIQKEIGRTAWRHKAKVLLEYASSL